PPQRGAFFLLDECRRGLINRSAYLPNALVEGIASAPLVPVPPSLETKCRNREAPECPQSVRGFSTKGSHYHLSCSEMHIDPEECRMLAADRAKFLLSRQAGRATNKWLDVAHELEEFQIAVQRHKDSENFFGSKLLWTWRLSMALRRHIANSIAIPA